jgi:hypothetical protein
MLCSLVVFIRLGVRCPSTGLDANAKFLNLWLADLGLECRPASDSKWRNLFCDLCLIVAIVSDK